MAGRVCRIYVVLVWTNAQDRMFLLIFMHCAGKHMHSDMQHGKKIKLQEGHEDLVDAVEAVSSQLLLGQRHCGQTGFHAASQIPHIF